MPNDENGTGDLRDILRAWVIRHSFAFRASPFVISREVGMSTTQATPSEAVEEVEIQGHIIDSLILPKVLDEILTHGGSYVLKEIRVGQRQTDLSYARIEVRAPTAAALREILDTIHDHGAVSTTSQDCRIVAADMNSAFPEGFYSTTNHRTQIRLRGEWIDVEDQEMDCGI